jgi:predicted PurR-regulated permease PerM
MPESLPRIERRRVERRINQRLSDLTIPEVRRILITALLSVVVFGLFLWMVRTVIIAAILAVVIALYLRPMYLRLLPRLGPPLAAMVTLAAVLLPVLGLLVYSYLEIADVATYVSRNQEQIARQIDASIRRLPFMESVDMLESVRRWVIRASDYGVRIPNAVRSALGSFSVAATVFLFTAFYVLVDAERILIWVRDKIPPRYSEFLGALEGNARLVLYGAIYSTLVTQSLKSAIIFVMNVAFGVPLAAVLAIVSFVIGFFPIVGSWSIYLPVAAWLAVFRDSPGSAVAMLAIGFFINTLYISTYLRPKLAAERSKVLNFYWMFVGLVTGVYTFGLAGILLGPILIGLLKAIIDTVTTTTNWRKVEEDGDEEVAEGV